MANITAPEFPCQQPDEFRQYTMDFSNLMSTGETISSIDAVRKQLNSGETTEDLTISSEAISGQTVTMWITGGSDRVVYRVEVKITTSTGQILVGDGKLRISEK